MLAWVLKQTDYFYFGLSDLYSKLTATCFIFKLNKINAVSPYEMRIFLSLKMLKGLEVLD